MSTMADEDARADWQAERPEPEEPDYDPADDYEDDES